MKLDLLQKSDKSINIISKCSPNLKNTLQVLIISHSLFSSEDAKELKYFNALSYL